MKILHIIIAIGKHQVKDVKSLKFYPAETGYITPIE